MLQYKIPQDVGVADKIVGPLTLRQLIIIAVGGGISYVLFAIASKLYELNILEYIIIALPAFIALAAAFIKINNIPFTKFILLSLEYAIKPKQRLWDHRGISSIVAPDLGEKKPAKSAVRGEGMKTKKDINLDDLSRVLDSGGFEHIKEIKHEDIDKAEDEDLMTEAYFGHKKKESDTENMYWRTKDSHKKRLEMLAKMPATKPVSATKPAQPAPAAAPPAPVKTEESKITAGKPEEKKASATIVAKQPEAKQAAQTQTVKKEKKPQTGPQLGPPIRTDARLNGEAGEVNPDGRLEKPFKKKKRRRRKKPKVQPVRSETQIDTTQKKKPAKFTPKQPLSGPVRTDKPLPAEMKNKQPLPEKKQESRGGEIHLEELKKGEIELNLD